MKKFGLGLDGCEQGVEQLLKQHINFSQSPVYTVVEVGSAGCVTLRAFKDIVSENRLGHWRVIGFDLPDGWSLDFAEINAVFNGKPNIYKIDDVDKDTPTNQMELWLLEDPRNHLKYKLPYKLDFVFIDGCHGKCAADDFLAIEPKVNVGGIVMFHDFGFLDQGRDFQPHCQEFINVRKHIDDIGLFDTRAGVNQNREFRKGWRFIGEIQGSRYWKPAESTETKGNSCGLFQKIS